MRRAHFSWRSGRVPTQLRVAGLALVLLAGLSTVLGALPVGRRVFYAAFTNLNIGGTPVTNVEHLERILPPGGCIVGPIVTCSTIATSWHPSGTINLPTVLNSGENIGSMASGDPDSNVILMRAQGPDPFVIFPFPSSAPAATEGFFRGASFVLEGNLNESGFRTTAVFPGVASTWFPTVFDPRLFAQAPPNVRLEIEGLGTVFLHETEREQSPNQTIVRANGIRFDFNLTTVPDAGIPTPITGELVLGHVEMVAERPIVGAISASSGGPGTPITINGTGFRPGETSVDIGGVPATDIEVTSPTELTATVPDLLGGTWPVNVTTPVDRFSLPNAFTSDNPTSGLPVAGEAFAVMSTITPVSTPQNPLPFVGAVVYGPWPAAELPEGGGSESESLGLLPAIPGANRVPGGLLEAEALEATTDGGPASPSLESIASSGPFNIGDGLLQADAALVRCDRGPSGPVCITSFVNLTSSALGDLPATPDPNTTIDIPGLGEVILNDSSDVVEGDMRLVATTGISVNLNIPGVATGTLLFLRAAIAVQATDVSGPLSPSTGPETGGTVVTIPGTGFVGSTTVSFGGVPAVNVSVDNATQITATTPAHAPGTVDVLISTPGGNLTLESAFTYTPVPAPTVTNIVPASGPVAGGILTTITGTNFMPGATVMFGNTLSPRVTIVDATTLQAVVPAAQSAGSADVVVTTMRGPSNGSVVFNYTTASVTPPTITGVAPSSGDEGTAVTISGQGFQPNATVTICNQVVVPDSISGTDVVFTAPACSVGGPQDVTVANPDGGFDTLPASFVYPGAGTSPPAIFGMNPNTGPVTGGTLVTISGANFLVGTTVHFGGTPSPAVQVLNPTTLQAQLPAAPGGQEGAVDVVVTTPIGTATLTGGFTYTPESGPTPPPSITDISPSQGSAGTVVTITGTGFQPTATVMICTLTVTPTAVSETEITFTAPFCVAGGAQNVTVTNPDGRSDTVPAAFTYGFAVAPTIDSVAPPSGPVAGGTVVTVTGSSFGGATVTFGGVDATTVVLSSTTLLVETPPAPSGSAGPVAVVVTTNNGSATLNDGFTYFGPGVDPPTITSIDPTTGNAGTPVTITGTGFQDGATVTICGPVVVDTDFVNPTEVQFIAPPCVAGPQDVSVMNPDFGSDTLPAGFTYAALQPPTASSINPTFGLPEGGTIVIITGTNFVPGTTVAFGTASPQPAVILNSTTLQVTTPPAPGPVPLQVDVTVTTPGGDAVLPDGFTYVSAPGAPPTITDVSPPEGDAGTPVTITGTGFQVGATVTICGRMVTPSSVSATEIAVTAPVCPAGGPQDVTVINPDGRFATAPNGFTYPPAEPTITSVAPPSGPVAGGITVTIRGTGFVDGTTVSFGGTESPTVSVENGTRLQAAVPPAPGGQPGPVDVTVTTPGGSATLPGAFNYTPAGVTPPNITSVSPATGVTGTPVTVTGDGFQPGVTVTICADVVAPVTASTTLVRFLAPPCQVGGPQDVTVTNLDGGSDTAPNAFTYGPLGPPTIVSITPPSGPVDGGTTVTITGTNFNGTSVTFGGEEGLNLTVLSSTTLVVETPPAPGGSPGTVDVVVTTENGSATFESGFTYFGPGVTPPEITLVDPASGNPGLNVTITGTGFQANATVTICGQIVATMFTSATEVAFSVPQCLLGGPQDVTLVNPDFGSDTLPAAFTYGPLQPPTVSNINPTFGPPDTVVTITGTNFVPGMTVTFGTAPPSQVTIFNSTTVQVTAPPAPGTPPLVVNLTVTTPGGEFTVPNGFTYSGSGTPVDSDGDGMSDDDENNFGLDPNDPTDAQEDPDGDGVSNIDEVNGDPPSHPRGFFAQYLAEGATGFFNTQVGIFNPNGSASEHVLVTLLPAPPNQAVGVPFVLDPLQRRTIDVGAELPDVPAGTGVSIRVESDEPISTMRQMLWDNPTGPYGSTLESGSPQPSRTWFFGEGATFIFDLFYLLANPNRTPANVTIRYLRADGPPITQEIVVDPSSRMTVLANQVPGLESAEVSAVIESDQPIVAERAMYLSLSGRPFDAGQAGVGVTEPSMEWFLAEGATNFFDTFVSIGNPNDETAHLLVTYQLPDGTTLNKQHEVPPQSRRTILVESEDPRLVDQAVAITVRSSSVPIIVERAMWWGPTAASWYESHSALGSTEAGTLWAVAEGASGGPAAEDTFLLVSNTAPELAWVRFTICYDDDGGTGGGGSGECEETIIDSVGNSRMTHLMRNLFPNSEGRRFSVLVESKALDANTPPAPITVEVSRYQSPNGLFGEAGGAALATKIR